MDFKDQLEIYKKRIDQELEKVLSAKVAAVQDEDEVLQFLHDAIKDFVIIGGKRLRPALVVATYKALTGKESDEIYRIALSLELFHNYTLIHDDFMDEDFKRRKKDNVNAMLKNRFKSQKYENRVYTGELFTTSMANYITAHAALAGNILRCWGEDLIDESPFSEAVRNKAIAIYRKADQVVNSGQAMDKELEAHKLEESDKVDEQRYMKMVQYKTAYLFRAAVELGSLLANAGEPEKGALLEYISSVAPAFQLQDDIMDISEIGEKGNTFGSDIKAGKKTLLVIKAYELAPGQRGTLNSILGNRDATDEQVQQAIDIIKSSAAIGYVKDLARSAIQAGISHLDRTGLQPSKLEFLTGMADYMLNRNI